MNLAAYPKYESYTDSGIDWIGVIPASWHQVANKHLFKLRKSQVGKRSSEYDLLSLTLGGIIKRDMENPEGKFPAEFDTYQEVRPGDFVFCLFDVEETPRTVGLSRFHGMITGAYTVYELSADADAKFLYYFYLNADTGKKLRSLYKGLRNTIPKDSFGAFKTPLPPLPEQRAIAAFLDEKCAKIDEAVRIKEEQIKLLRERRQILIRQAVTRGLNPDAPMKDSGIDWIGQIPAHWELKRIKDVSKSVRTGRTPPSSAATDYYAEGVVPWYTPGDVLETGEFASSEKLITQAAVNHSHVDVYPANSIYFIGIGGTLGKANLSRNAASCNQQFNVIVPADNVEPEWVLIWLNSSREVVFNQTDYTTMPIMNQAKTKRIPITVPPRAEQLSILSGLSHSRRKIEQAISVKEDQIAALKEYKTSLINAAVTGKIKVT